MNWLTRLGITRVLEGLDYESENQDEERSDLVCL